MLVWFFSLPERKLQSHEAIRICDTSQIIIYRASFLSISDSEMALFEVQQQNYTVTAFISKESSLKHLTKIKCWKIWVYLDKLSKVSPCSNLNVYYQFYSGDKETKPAQALEFRVIRTFILSSLICSPGFNRDLSSKDFFILERLIIVIAHTYLPARCYCTKLFKVSKRDSRSAHAIVLTQQEKFRYN